MQGDFSRSTFDPARGYRAVLLQQGRVLLDCEVNEQAAITAHHDQTRTLDAVGASGGPLPLDGGPGPFAVVNASGVTPTGPTPWTGLLVTPGRYYADGVLAESQPNPSKPGWPLTDQPHLPAIGTALGLPDPAAKVAVGGRVGLFLDVWEHHVTADEDPSLLEPALGGPDTSTRSQTVWQVRWVPLEKGDDCAAVPGVSGLTAPRRTMAALLADPAPSDDACRITASGGYQLLENQLYRVQVHSVAADGSAKFLWSRENGSVVAGIRSFGATSGGTTELVLDRDGRDEELSFHDQSLVEVTSEDLVLRGEPGFLARAGAPRSSGTAAEGLTLPVTWLDTAPTYAQLGKHPVARRWEGGPLSVKATPTSLEGGISVLFDATSAPLRAGDYWQIPARTVQLAYGLTARTGTIQWPTDGTGKARLMPPAGVVHHVAPLATLLRDATGWIVQSDCRSLFPPLTELVTIDLVGGDGQEAMPGAPLPAPVRVVVRNGGVPVVGARVWATARSVPASGTKGGVVDTTDPIGAAATSTVTAKTGPDGVAQFWWRLDAGGSSTQTLTLNRLDGTLPATDAEVVATARLSIASQVAWDSAKKCTGFAGAATVGQALDQLSTTRSLALLGGDGQEAGAPGAVLPRPVRLAVTSPCGPVAGAKVTASAVGGFGQVDAAPSGAATPTTLGGQAAAAVFTGPDGVAEFWWAPEFPDRRSAVLDCQLAESSAPPVHVVAGLDARAQAPGLHINGLQVANKPLRNDDSVSPTDLARGITVRLDGLVDPASVAGKPVVHVSLALPWPVPGDGDIWGSSPVGTRMIELAGQCDCKEDHILWRPDKLAATWMVKQLWSVLQERQLDARIQGRLVIDSWAIQGAGDQRGVPINGHAVAVMDGTRTELVLPTDDAVTGGRYEAWFWLVQPTRTVAPNVVGLAQAEWRKALLEAGIPADVVDVQTQPSRQPKGSVLSMDPPAGTPLEPGARVRIVVSG